MTRDEIPPGTLDVRPIPFSQLQEHMLSLPGAFNPPPAEGGRYLKRTICSSALTLYITCNSIIINYNYAFPLYKERG